MPTLKYLDPADGLYKPILGGSAGSGGGGTEPAPNEVSIGSVKPTDGSELWLDTSDGVLHYRKPSDGSYVEITGSVIPPTPVDGNIVAGSGLTGGGLQSTSPTLNVGQGAGITVAADTVAVNKGTLDGWYAPMNGQSAVTITDWNQAVLNNTMYMGNNAAHAPDTGWFYGFVFSYAANFKHQLVFPFANSRWNAAAMWEREMEGSVWGDWSRFPQYLFGRDTGGAMHFFQHNSSGANLGVRRFASGFYKDQGSNNPTASDQWRVQCYDLAGSYVWSGIVVAESGAVSFPKGHSLLQSQMDASEPVPTDQAATVGMVVELVVRLMQRAGITVDPAEVITLLDAEEPPA